MLRGWVSIKTLIQQLLLQCIVMGYAQPAILITSAPFWSFPSIFCLQVILGLLLVLTVLVNMLGNSVVCLIVYQKPAMRSSINLLLANMAFSNILLALLASPFPLATLVTDLWVLGGALCDLAAALHTLFLYEAVCILWVISVDRYLIIVHRKDKLTPYRARVIIMTSWVLVVFVSVPPVLGWGQYGCYLGWLTCTLREYHSTADLMYVVLSYTVMFYLPMATMGFCFLCILNTVRRNKSRVHIQTPVDGLSMSQMSKLGLPGATTTKVTCDMSFKTRAFKTILILYMVYVACWAPYAVCMMYWNYAHSISRNYIGGACVLWLGYVNGALNPIIYCLRIKKFREACREIIPKSLRMLSFPDLPERNKRRINPSSAYECNDPHSNV